jgi:hypothetical protein
LIYPSDYSLFRDSAYAVRRSIHAYDIIPVIDYTVASRIPAVYVYDIIQTYNSAYASRRSVIHAYDVISQGDSATKSGQITVSARDILVTPEWFFRVSKALKILELYSTFELATAYAVPTVYVKDLVIYDAEALLNTIKTASALDAFTVADSASYAKSYSPLFFTLLQRRMPVRYATLNVLDAVSVSDSLNSMVVKAVSASDFVLADSATYSKSYSQLFFTLFRRRIPVRYLTLSVSDSVPVLDFASIVGIKVVSVFDAVVVADYAAVRNIAVRADDYVLYDYVAHIPPSNIRYRSLYANVGMRTISVFDKITLYESVWVGPRVVAVHVRDHLVSDGASVVRRSVHAYDVLISDNVNIVRIA